jgi:ribosomal protein S27E
MPIEFRCPHCQTQTTVPDSSAGRTGSCLGCGKPLRIPASGGPDVYASPGKQSISTILVIAVLLPVGLLALLCCGGVLLGLTLPAVNAAREAARKTVCANNLKQISLAMSSYQDNNGSLPPAFVADKNGRPMHSWRVLLLPYLDCQPLYSAYHFDEPWDGPHNRVLANRMPPIYHCPSAGPMGSVTSYVVIVGPHTAFPGAKPVRSEQLKDPANTIAVVEAPRAGINWLEPRDLSEADMQFKINGSASEIGSFHVHGANVSYCDSSVHYLADSMDAKVLKQLIDQSGK